MSKYTDSMVAELVSKETWTWAECQEFASRFPEISPKSVVSKIKNLELEYVPKEPETKSTEPQIKKSDIVRDIADALRGSYDSLAGLSNSNKQSLEYLRSIVASEVTE